MSAFLGLSPRTYVGTGPDAGAEAGARWLSAQERTAVMWTIVDELVKARAPDRLHVPLRDVVFGCWANAWGESGFDPGAWRRERDGRTSYGVFQCLTPGGAGEGHNVTDLIKPDYSTQVILGEVFRAHASRPAPFGSEAFTAWFVRYVERPKYPDTAIQKRCAWLRQWGGAT